MKRFNCSATASALLIILGLTLTTAAFAESYTYDNIGRLTSVTYDDDSSIAYAYDNNGNILEKIIEGIPDTTPPVISLVGTTPLTIAHGAVYSDAGATASDDIDGDISASIVTINPVNTLSPGTYTVTYNVADAAGNVASQATRSVTVSEAIVNVRKKPGGGCAINQSASFDPILILMSLVSMIYLMRRRKRLGTD